MRIDLPRRAFGPPPPQASARRVPLKLVGHVPSECAQHQWSQAGPHSGRLDRVLRFLVTNTGYRVDTGLPSSRWKLPLSVSHLVCILGT